MREKIRNTANLRDFLADVMVQVRDGTIKPDVASPVAKIAHAINESFNVELRLALLARQSGEIAPNLGRLALGEIESGPPIEHGRAPALAQEELPLGDGNLISPRKLDQARELLAKEGHNLTMVAGMLDVSKRDLHAALHPNGSH